MIIILSLAVLLAIHLDAQVTYRISLSGEGGQANHASILPRVSADGRWVVFESFANNLVGGDTNGCSDIFIKDSLTGMIERVSVTANGQQANTHSCNPDISADGRFVSFFSYASNLVPGDTNGCGDEFVRDRQAQTTFRVSVSSSGNQGNNLSNGGVISGNGRLVAFASKASNLVPGDTNDRIDVFVHDTLYRTTEIVSISSTGAIGNGDSSEPSISHEGSVVAFSSLATNLGRGDTNGVKDIFVRLRDGRSTTRVSLNRDGVQGNAVSEEPTVSGNGRWIAFTSLASNLVNNDTNSVSDVFVFDLNNRIPVRASISTGGHQGNCLSFEPSISHDGSLVAFTSNASNLVSNDTNGCTDVLVRNLTQGVTFRVSTATGGGQGNHHSWQPAIASNSPLVVYLSWASNLVTNDSNGFSDIFMTIW